MRKILYSPGYGAGWSSWVNVYSSKEVKLFMLEYQPFITALENDEKLNEEQFLEDFKKQFPNQWIPYTGGMNQLEIMEVPDGMRVKINEYDGNESVEVEGEFDDWL